jgi:hypothetical protein
MVSRAAAILGAPRPHVNVVLRKSIPSTERVHFFLGGRYFFSILAIIT